jgi:hypothetical protein
MARGSDPEGLARVKAKEKNLDFAEGKVAAGANDQGRARVGFGPSGVGKKENPHKPPRIK